MGGPPYNVARLLIYHKNFKNFFQKFHLKFFFRKLVKISHKLAKFLGNLIPGFHIFSRPKRSIGEFCNVNNLNLIFVSIILMCYFDYTKILNAKIEKLLV